MQNIQDLKEKIFFESKNIIGILGKIGNAGELSSRQDLVDELAEKVSFLRLLEKNIGSFSNENYSSSSENAGKKSSFTTENETYVVSTEVMEEEAVFNNELNEIEGEFSMGKVTEEEAVFNNQLNEIIEGELHETLVNFAQENSEASSEIDLQSDIDDKITEKEAVFNIQLNEINENESADCSENRANFVDEERILADAEPENGQDIHEEIFDEKTTEEEAIFNNQLNEIDKFENEFSKDKGNVNSFEEEKNRDQNPENKDSILNTFESEIRENEDHLNEDNLPNSNIAMQQGEMANESSNIDHILNEIKSEGIAEEKNEQSVLAEISDRRKITEIDKPQIEKENHSSDESFENLEQYHHDKKIKLANIKGMKTAQSFFDDDHMHQEMPEQQPVPPEKEDTGNILKNNISSGFIEPEKQKPEFKLDLNDRIAFSKTLFGGSQSEMNEVVHHLNSFRTLEEAKEYLSDLYYQKKWDKVDEYAQRLWILVENKFL